MPVFDQGAGLDQRQEPLFQEERVAVDVCAYSRVRLTTGAPTKDGLGSYFQHRHKRREFQFPKPGPRSGLPEHARGPRLPGRAPAAGWRLIKGGPLVKSARSSVNRKDMASAQCRSSRTKTVGPLAVSRATNALQRRKSPFATLGAEPVKGHWPRRGTQAHQMGQKGDVIHIPGE